MRKRAIDKYGAIIIGIFSAMVVGGVISSITYWHFVPSDPTESEPEASGMIAGPSSPTAPAPAQTTVMGNGDAVREQIAIGEKWRTAREKLDNAGLKRNIDYGVDAQQSDSKLCVKSVSEGTPAMIALDTCPEDIPKQIPFDFIKPGTRWPDASAQLAAAGYDHSYLVRDDFGIARNEACVLLDREVASGTYKYTQYILGPCGESEAAPEPTATPSPTSTPAPAKKGKSHYKNCKDVWNTVGHPIDQDDPGYAPDLDADSDGIACEVKPDY